MKKFITILSLASIFSVGAYVISHKQEFKTEFQKYEIKAELKDTYSQYNMLMKNKRHGANVPQQRLDNLQEKANELKARLKTL
ncbi:MAG: hypothetical protein ACRCX2_09605 [Paraclostridium sp.]